MLSGISLDAATELAEDPGSDAISMTMEVVKDGAFLQHFDVVGWQVTIDWNGQLFVDDHLIAGRYNVRLQTHHSEKYLAIVLLPLRLAQRVLSPRVLLPLHPHGRWHEAQLSQPSWRTERWNPLGCGGLDESL